MLRPAAHRGLATVALLLFVIGCSRTSTPPPVANRGPMPEPPVPSLDWRACSGGDCATVTVPVDHADPDGEQLDIALIRTSTARAGDRIGTLLLNPGGPGGSGIEMARYLLLPDAITARFDIVGFDPRGVGASEALDCHEHLQAMYDADPTMDGDDDRKAFLAVSQDFVDDCADRHGDLLDHMGTADVARDLDLIRRALGDDELNFLGYSYGTVIGQQYARLFPDRVRTMVLDGLVDPGEDGLDGAVKQALAFEEALDRFIAWCDERRCVGEATGPLVDRVIDGSGADPIPSSEGARPATRGVVSLAISQALYADWMWGDLAFALIEADAGDGTGLVELADDYLGRIGDDYLGGLEVYFAVGCLDSPWPDDPDVVFDTAAEVAERAPRIAEAIVNDYVRCSIWPAEPDPLEPIPADAVDLAPILLVSTTGDPATPHATAVALAASIPNAGLLTHRGEGHTIVAGGDPCVDEAVADYLVTGRLPEPGLTC